MVMTEASQESGQKQHIDKELLLEALQTDNIEKFRSEFLEMHSYDQATFFKELDESERLHVYHFLSPEEMANLFENLEIEDDEYSTILAQMSPSYAADMLSNMYADNAVDVLNELNKDQVVSYLTIMDKTSAEEIKELLHYEEYTAGSIMTTEFIAIAANQTVRSAMHILKTKAPSS